MYVFGAQMAQTIRLCMSRCSLENVIRKRSSLCFIFSKLPHFEMHFWPQISRKRHLDGKHDACTQSDCRNPPLPEGVSSLACFSFRSQEGEHPPTAKNTTHWGPSDIFPEMETCQKKDSPREGEVPVKIVVSIINELESLSRCFWVRGVFHLHHDSSCVCKRAWYRKERGPLQ